MAHTTDEVARGAADVALKLSTGGPRDALLDPRDGDIIPDLAEKGYHLGEVAQPAEPVLHRSGAVTFESLAGAPESKFAGAMSFADQKAANQAVQAKDPAYKGVAHVPDGNPEYVAADDRLDSPTRPRRAAAPVQATPTSNLTGNSASKLDRDSARVASAQTAEDKR